MIDTLPIDELSPNPFQPREKVQKQDLDEMVLSVREYGILEPLVVAKTPAGFQIIAGERRWRAAKAAGLTEVPVVIKVTTPKGMLEMALVENVQRVDLSALERAQAFQQLSRDFGYSRIELGQRIGKSAAYVSNSLRLLELPDAIKDGLVSGALSEGHGRALAGLLENQPLMIQVFKQVLREKASVRRAEQLVRFAKEQEIESWAPPSTPGQPQNESKKRKKTYTVDDPALKGWSTQLKRAFDIKTKVKIQQSSRRTAVTLAFYGSPEETEASLKRLLSLTDQNEVKTE